MIPDQYNVENRLNQLEMMYKPTVPYISQAPQQPQPNISVAWVRSVDGVSSYPVKFGGSVLLIDPQANMMYLKVVDHIGAVKISAYSFKEVSMPTAKTEQSAEVMALSDRLSTLEKIIISITQKEGVNVQATNATEPKDADNPTDGTAVHTKG